MKTAGSLLVALALTTFAACDGSTVAPSQAGPPPPSSSGSVPRLGGFSLSGAVVESSSTLVQGGTVLFSLDSRPEGHVAVDGHGRYTIPNLPVGRLVRITWTAPAALGELLHQPYPVNTTISGRHRAEHRGRSTGFSLSSPALRRRCPGVVYETTAARATAPHRHARVLLDEQLGRGSTRIHKRTRTGVTPSVESHGVWGGLGRATATTRCVPIVVDVNGDTVVDFDLTSFNASCP